MTSEGLRKRHYNEVSEDDLVTQPLLNSSDGNSNYRKGWIVKSSGWPSLLCHFLKRWARWLGNIVKVSALWCGNMLLCGCAHEKSLGEKPITVVLTPLQEERLKRLQLRLEVAFDRTRPDHQEALKALWHAAFPNIELKGLISDQWKEMGWQGNDPSTDFRGGGYISLENLLFFAKNFQVCQQKNYLLIFIKGCTPDVLLIISCLHLWTSAISVDTVYTVTLGGNINKGVVC
ncbi:hypothetical protein KP509_06G018100 [Ceratopteris richardii]|uniref:ELMO domain-containing protein n=1 Tax=Ceratopteris richardii TaxID=49495 RepID=A0A8T2UM54_CERRI|nr:hypothetical protein KP509_06G018100 [Ceratopteris richardii]